MNVYNRQVSKFTPWDTIKTLHTAYQIRAVY